MINSLWRKFRALPTVAAVGVFFAGLAFALATARTARGNRKAATYLSKSEERAAAGAQRDLAQAKQLNEKAAAHKLAADRAKQRAETRLDEIAGNDETLSDLVDSWNADRLRG